MEGVVYTGERRRGIGAVVLRRRELGARAAASEVLEPGRSQALRNHSPDGFEWGYGGSGPNQLALALLLDVTGEEEFSLASHADFCRDVVSQLPEREWTLTAKAIEAWVDEVRALVLGGGGIPAHVSESPFVDDEPELVDVQRPMASEHDAAARWAEEQEELA